MKTFLKVIGIFVALLFIAGAVLYFKNKNTYRISGSSMNPTLMINDTLRADPDAYKQQAPTRGDVVVYKSSDNYVVIGRVVGVPGDHISFEDSKLYVNEKPAHNKPGTTVQSEDGTYFEEVMEALKEPAYPVWYLQVEDKFISKGTFDVGDDHFFIMGDNRDFAKDSRVTGPVIRGQILGRAKKIVDSDKAERIGREL